MAMDINERKAQVKAIFRDACNWWLANCDLDMSEQFFINAAREMVKLSDAGDPLKNSLLLAVYGEYERIAREQHPHD